MHFGIPCQLDVKRYLVLESNEGKKKKMEKGKTKRKKEEEETRKTTMPQEQPEKHG